MLPKRILQNPEFRVNIRNYNNDKLQRVHFFAGSDGIDISPVGYGNKTSEDGYGVPIFIETTEEGLRLVVWADINNEEPTHIINLEGARDSARKND